MSSTKKKRAPERPRFTQIDIDSLGNARRALRRSIADLSMWATLSDGCEMPPREIRRARDRAALALAGVDLVLGAMR